MLWIPLLDKGKPAQKQLQRRICVVVKSCQAVSNWERGNSMPDIGKLGELSDLLEISLEELLGHTTVSANIQRVISQKDSLENLKITLSELSDISPVLPPDITGQLARQLRARDVEELSMIAPFVSKEKLEQMGEGLKAKSVEDLCAIAPFIGQETLDHMIGEELRARDVEELSMIAPFVSKEKLEQLGEGLKARSVEDLCAIAPFVSRTFLDTLILGYPDRT